MLLNSFNQALQLHYAAKKYMLLGLAKECCDYMFDYLTTDKVWSALEFAEHYDYSHLRVFNDNKIIILTFNLIKYKDAPCLYFD